MVARALCNNPEEFAKRSSNSDSSDADFKRKRGQTFRNSDEDSPWIVMNSNYKRRRATYLLSYEETEEADEQQPRKKKSSPLAEL